MNIKTHLLNTSCGKLISDSTRILDSIQLIIVSLETGEGIKGIGYTYTLRGGEGVKAIIEEPMVDGDINDYAEK
ncbi:MAG: hypothetical protein QXZ08_02725 [Nitrososphaeria archaeon]